MRYKITHTTTYDYSKVVSHSYNQAHLIPRSTSSQTCLDHQFNILPLPEDVSTRIDVYGNLATYFDLRKPHKEFVVTSTSEVDVEHTSQTEFLPDEPTVHETQQILQNAYEEDTRMCTEFLLDSDFVRKGNAVYEYAKPVFLSDIPLRIAVGNLMEKIFSEFEYDPHFSDTATPLESVLQHKRGVCQDFAHLAIACLRSHGLAARYVSGYLETIPPPGKKKLIGSDASHAWFSVYIPGNGWLDFDPTNNQIPSGQHITLAWGRDYSDVTPLKGVLFGGGQHTVDVSVDVQKLNST